MTLPKAGTHTPLRRIGPRAVALPNEKRAREAATPHAQTTTTQEVIPVHSNCSTARVSRHDVECAVAPSPAAVLMLIECDSCNRRIEAPRDEYLACGAVEEWLEEEEEGWCLRGYLAYCPTCVRLWPVCDSCDQSTHPREIADHNPPVVCMACAQWDDDGELVSAFRSQAVFGVGR